MVVPALDPTLTSADYLIPSIFTSSNMTSAAVAKAHRMAHLKIIQRIILIADMIALMDHLKIDKAHLAGGSWGSTLALAFAMKHPARVSSLLIYGIFLCRPCEFRALYFEGGVVSQLYPEVFEALH